MTLWSTEWITTCCLADHLEAPVAKAEAVAAPKLTLSELKNKKLSPIDAMFYLAFGIFAIATVVAIGVR